MTNFNKEYITICLDLNDCSNKKDVRRHNKAMKKLSVLYHQIENESDKSFLLELLKNDNGQVRCTAAAHCLGLGIYLNEAKKVLKCLAKNKHDIDLAFEAESVLDVWKEQGYLNF